MSGTQRTKSTQKAKITRRKVGRPTSLAKKRPTPHKIERSKDSDDSVPTTLLTGPIRDDKGKKRDDKGKKPDDKGKERETRDDIITVTPPQPADFATELAAARARWKKQEREWQRKHKTVARTPAALRSERDAGPPQGGRMALADPPLDNPMQEGTQRMVASATDLMDVKALQELHPDRYRMLTPNQVWILVAAERKGQAQHESDMQKSERKLAQINEQFGTKYPAKQLSRILEGIRNRRLASNFFLSLPPGGNRVTGATGPTLLEMFIADKDDRFKNVWETGTSQASADFSQRGGVEERFGYAAALKRTEGTPLGYIGGRFSTVNDPARATPQLPEGSPASEFAELAERGDDYLRRLQEETPNYLQPREMPKYAAAVGDSQAYGVSARYGSSVIYWKRDLGWRTTRTPGDSWSNDPLQSAMSFVSAAYPESVFAYTDPDIARLAAAEATDFKFDAELKSKVAKDGADLKAYVEAQIHGDLTWHDVDEVVLNYGTFPGKESPVVVTREQAQQEMGSLEQFAKEKGYGFTVRLGRERTAG